MAMISSIVPLFNLLFTLVDWSLIDIQTNLDTDQYQNLSKY